MDSPLEGAGFELSVPRQMDLCKHREIAADRDTGGADWRGIDENGSNGLSGVSSVNARRSARGWEAGGELGEIGARPYYHQSHKNAVSPQTVS